MQQGEGQEVEPGDVRAGDLYCFGDHVAIAVGEGTIVHATGAHGRTVEEPMPDELLAGRVLAIRRVYENSAGL
jgi:cell wall-associated NlpC family hydrolase